MYGRLLDRFNTLRAVVAGDLMLDEYIQGKATRISPEAPVMVVRHQQTRRVPGGAANVARNVAALGAACTVIGVVGDDEAGELLAAEIERSGLSDSVLLRESGRKTTRKTRVLADHAHQVLRIDSEDDMGVSHEIEQEIVDQIKAKLADADVLILSDYLKGGLTATVAKEAIAHAKALGRPVVVNPKPRSVDFYAGADLVSLNRAEAAEALGLLRGLPDSQAEVAAGALRDRLGSSALITLGESGMVAASASRMCRVGAPLVEVYDTAGAGDTVVATAALGMAAVGFEKLIFDLAAQTSAHVVRHTGVVAPSAEDLAEIRSL